MRALERSLVWSSWRCSDFIGTGECIRGGEGGQGLGRRGWVRFAPARGNVAFCCAVLRRVARSADRSTTESGRARRREGGGGCRFGGWVRFALASGWRALAGFGTVWRALARGWAEVG